MTDEFESAVSAYDSVKAAKSKLKEEQRSVNVEIDAAKKELAWLQHSYLPLQDLKDFIIQFLIKHDQDYDREIISPAISSLATNGCRELWFPSGSI